MSNVNVVVCTWDNGSGGLVGDVEELLTLGRGLAGSLGGELRLLALGAAPEDLAATAGRHGVAGLDRIEDAKITAEVSADAYVAALAGYCEQESPKVVLMSQTFDARLVGPRLAGRLGSAAITNAVGVEADGGTLNVTCSAYGGDTRVVYACKGEGPVVINVMANACVPADADAATSPEARVIAVDLGAVEERIRIVERPTVEGEKLEEAEIIVAGGRGLGEAGNFALVEALAAQLGGMAGASRPIVDDGWVDASRQVGLTGKITRPALYIAAGISGASQHMAGCAASKTIAAINTDKTAAIFRYARYGIVGDCTEILPELTKAAKG